MSTARLVAHEIEKKWRSNDIKLEEDADFSSLCLSKPLLNGLKQAGFIKPSPIQLRAIPLGKVGLDLIVQAKSGTGKTCVFTVIALQSLCLSTKLAQVLVIAPTREIAYQICQVITSIGSEYKDLSCQIFIGGLPIEQDKKKLTSCHIAVGTPGRIKQLIEMNIFKPQSIRLLVLDEADKLIMSNAKDDVNWIYRNLPENKQIVTCSATYQDDLINWLQHYMRNPMCVRLDADKPALLGLMQFYTKLPYHPQQHIMHDIKQNILCKILGEVSFSQCLIFANYQAQAERLYDQLKIQNWPVAFICGTQDQLKRIEVINKLKNFECRILISTDLTARGIDAEHVNLVINYEPPWDAETYLHRIGRAGRYGSYGLSITLASERVEFERLLTIQHQAHLDLYNLPSELAKIWEHVPQPEDFILSQRDETEVNKSVNSVQDESAEQNISTVSPSNSSVNPVTSSTESQNCSTEPSLESNNISSNQHTLDWAEMVDSNESSNGTKDTVEVTPTEDQLQETLEENAEAMSLDREIDLSFLKKDSKNQCEALTYSEAKEDLEDFLSESSVELPQTQELPPTLPYTRQQTLEISLFLQKEIQKLTSQVEEEKKKHSKEEMVEENEKKPVDQTSIGETAASSSDLSLMESGSDLQPPSTQPDTTIRYTKEELLKYSHAKVSLNSLALNEKFLELDMLRQPGRKPIQSFQKRDLFRERPGRANRFPMAEKGSPRRLISREKIAKDPIAPPSSKSDLQKDKVIRTAPQEKLASPVNGNSSQISPKKILAEEKLEEKIIQLPEKDNLPEEKVVPGEVSAGMEPPILKVDVPPNSTENDVPPKQPVELPEAETNVVSNSQESEWPREAVTEVKVPLFKKKSSGHPKEWTMTVEQQMNLLTYLQPGSKSYKAHPPIHISAPYTPPLPESRLSQMMDPSFSSTHPNSKSESLPDLVSSSREEMEEPPRRRKGKRYKSRFSLPSRPCGGTPRKLPTPCSNVYQPHYNTTPCYYPPPTFHSAHHITPHQPSTHPCCMMSSPHPRYWPSNHHATMPTPICRNSSTFRPNITKYCNLVQNYQHNINRMKQWFRSVHAQNQCCHPPTASCNCLNQHLFPPFP